ncbi:RagB/SusD family nutrient uptake outer membrane protein [Parabacteroides sp. Marseille-P3160]|uniref:RagB/SusD family nutrient uptake outer membrane protein n=1 Tax=Parabacteroides sp. Marseille-P3160 TaxID=1917887 RepID=UPI0009BB1023|nr:RagB/SusD family nutrient uptake outer membrane protein [Parabacteroides sp. Marseille-P3160]
MKNLFNRIFIICTALSSILFVSCSDTLDQAPDGKISLDDVFADNDKVGAFLNSCYDYIPTQGTRYYFWSRGPVVWSDEAWDTDAEAESGLMAGRMYNGNASASSHPITDISSEGGNGVYWDRYWAVIRNCSMFIGRIETATVKSDTDRKRWKAEAHLLRAFYYSELLRWFGCDLPIEREVYDWQQDFSTVTRNSYYEIVKFILEDCDVALNTSELPWRITESSEKGRVTKAMAEAVKSRMMLYAASPLYNQGQNYWAEAYSVNKTSLENLRAKGYELYNKINYPQTYLVTDAFLPNEKAAIYNEYFTQNVQYSSNSVDKETIYMQKDGQGNIWDIDGIGAQDGYKSGTCPSQELVDAYETTDGEPILDLANPYKDEQHILPNYNPKNTLYDPETPYENRDPRFYASIYYNGSARKALFGFTETPDSPENYFAPLSGNRIRYIMTYVGEPQTGIDGSKRSATRTGYYERKFLHPFAGNDIPVAGAQTKTFRLGEIILNFAEAAAETGHLDEARSAVNEIRARAGMPALPEGLSQNEMILRVRQERRIELAMEGFRYFDVRRWCTPTGDLAKTDQWITAMEITRVAANRFTYKRRPVRSTERKCYTNKYLKVPIPLNEVNRMVSITGENWQNPGW